MKVYKDIFIRILVISMTFLIFGTVAHAQKKQSPKNSTKLVKSLGRGMKGGPKMGKISAESGPNVRVRRIIEETSRSVIHMLNAKNPGEYSDPVGVSFMSQNCAASGTKELDGTQGTHYFIKLKVGLKSGAKWEVKYVHVKTRDYTLLGIDISKNGKVKFKTLTDPLEPFGTFNAFKC